MAQKTLHRGRQDESLGSHNEGDAALSVAMMTTRNPDNTLEQLERSTCIAIQVRHAEALVQCLSAQVKRHLEKNNLQSGHLLGGLAGWEEGQSTIDD